MFILKSSNSCLSSPHLAFCGDHQVFWLLSKPHDGKYHQASNQLSDAINHPHYLLNLLRALQQFVRYPKAYNNRRNRKKYTTYPT